MLAFAGKSVLKPLNFIRNVVSSDLQYRHCGEKVETFNSSYATDHVVELDARHVIYQWTRSCRSQFTRELCFICLLLCLGVQLNAHLASRSKYTTKMLRSIDSKQLLYSYLTTCYGHMLPV